jgi:hypothetical protein
VALIVAATLLARRAEWLAGARACPNRSVLWPSGEPQGKRPSADAGEKVAMPVAAQIVGAHVGNGSLVNVAGGQVSGRNEVAQPLGRELVPFVVIV